MKQIPTAMSAREAQALQRFARGQRVVECGALLGYSTLVLADVATSVVSVDRHSGYGPSTLRAFRSNIEGVPNITSVVGDARDVLPHLCAERYFIDLDGTYETTRAMIDAIRGDAMIAVHDFARSHCAGVERAIRDCEVLEVIDTLAILRKR